MSLVSGKCVAVTLIANIPAGMDDKTARVWLTASVALPLNVQLTGKFVEVRNQSGEEYSQQTMARIASEEKGGLSLV